MSKARPATPCRRSAATPSPIRCSAPGAIDLTAHVDFQALAHAAEAMGAGCYGPIEQAQFLRRLGIETRAATLKAKATPSGRPAIDIALARLIGAGRNDMGMLFKAAGFAHPTLGALPGFEPPADFACYHCDACCRPHRSPSLPASATASSPAPAACRRASMRASTAASARRTRPTRSPRTAPAWRRRSASRPSACSRPTRSIRPRWWSPRRRGRANSARAPTPSSRACPGSPSASRPPTAGRCCSPTRRPA